MPCCLRIFSCPLSRLVRFMVSVRMPISYFWRSAFLKFLLAEAADGSAPVLFLVVDIIFHIDTFLISLYRFLRVLNSRWNSSSFSYR